jgi:hypothetical protein
LQLLFDLVEGFAFLEKLAYAIQQQVIELVGFIENVGRPWAGTTTSGFSA